jgi:citrate synthase
MTNDGLNTTNSTKAYIATNIAPTTTNGTRNASSGFNGLRLWGRFVNSTTSSEEVDVMTSTLQRRSHVPNYVFDTIEALPVTTHPMTMFVVGIMALQNGSHFAKAYASGMNKKDYWDATFDDSLDLIARLPRIAAYIYRRKYKDSQHIEPNGLLDWSGNFAHMMGYGDAGFKELMRLYMTIHADHEGGNVSAHTTHLVGSALSDPFLSFAAGMNGLAGPLHGLANQEVIKWIFELREHLGVELPTKEQIGEYVKQTLASGGRPLFSWMTLHSI